MLHCVPSMGNTEKIMNVEFIVHAQATVGVAEDLSIYVQEEFKPMRHQSNQRNQWVNGHCWHLPNTARTAKTKQNKCKVKRKQTDNKYATTQSAQLKAWPNGKATEKNPIHNITNSTCGATSSLQRQDVSTCRAASSALIGNILPPAILRRSLGTSNAQFKN